MTHFQNLKALHDYKLSNHKVYRLTETSPWLCVLLGLYNLLSSFVTPPGNTTTLALSLPDLLLLLKGHRIGRFSSLKYCTPTLFHNSNLLHCYPSDKVHSTTFKNFAKHFVTEWICKGVCSMCILVPMWIVDVGGCAQRYAFHEARGQCQVPSSIAWTYCFFETESLTEFRAVVSLIRLADQWAPMIL